MHRLCKVLCCLLFVSMITFTTHQQLVKAEHTVMEDSYLQIETEVPLHSNNAILINLNDDRILYDKNATDKIYPASMTKIMTTLVALENIDDLDTKCTISEAMLAGLSEANASVAGFQVNEQISYRDLLYGILLPSGADASRAIAMSIFQDENEFVAKMNEKAEFLQLKQTHFVNVSGLHDDEHYSSVYDIAVLLKAALRNEQFKTIFCSRNYTCENGLMLYSTMFTQATANQMDVDFIAGAKTGFTNEASLCLASYALHNEEAYIMVSAQTNSNSAYPYHIEDAIHLYQYVFDHYERVIVVKKNELIKALPVKWGDISTYDMKADHDISLLIKDGNTKNLKKVYDGPQQLEAPLFYKDLIGTFSIYEGNKLIFSMDINMQDKIEKNMFAYYLAHIDQFFIDFKYVIGLCLIACVGNFTYHRYRKNK